MDIILHHIYHSVQMQNPSIFPPISDENIDWREFLERKNAVFENRSEMLELESGGFK